MIKRDIVDLDHFESDSRDIPVTSAHSTADAFDDDFVVSLGRGYATMLKRAGKTTITLGRDCRLSSERLFGLLSDGLLQSGINVVDIGVVPTPLLYFSVIHWRMDGGAMITGSHNAAEYNGFKLGVGPSTMAARTRAACPNCTALSNFPLSATLR
mgnify:CR=1 FL=1